MNGLNVTFVSNEELDNKDNYNKMIYFVNSNNRSFDGYKWIIISEFMFLQGIMISALKGHNNKNIIIGASKIKVETQEVVFEYDYIITSEYFIKLPKISIAPNLTIGGLDRLKKDIDRLGININVVQLKKAYLDMNRLISFDNLLDRLKKEKYKCYPEDMVIKPTIKSYEWIKKMKMLRNEFNHYLPKFWVMDTEYLSEAIIETLKYCKNILEFRKDHFANYREEWCLGIDNIIATNQVK